MLSRFSKFVLKIQAAEICWNVPAPLLYSSTEKLLFIAIFVFWVPWTPLRLGIIYVHLSPRNMQLIMYQNGDTMMAVGCANKGDRIIFEVQSECVIKEFECVINLNTRTIIIKQFFITINFTRKNFWHACIK